MSQKFLNRQIQVALYSLKRLYGGAIVIYHLVSSEADPQTGVAEVKTIATRISRAIILPVKVTREVERNISIISANKQMVMGGSHEGGKRVFIIERRDAPNLVLVKDDWLAYEGAKYAIESIEEYEFKSAWVIVAKHLAGETASSTTLVQSLEASDQLQVSQSGEEG